MIKVKIPATVANLGPGFDCMGLALNMYNYIELEETEYGVEIIPQGIVDKAIPTNEKNLVYMAVKKVLNRLNYHPKGIRIRLTNNIPLTRGLGSSAACIAGGMLAANYLAGNKLSIRQIINMSSEMEGHPDNVVPAIVGGMTICMVNDKIIEYVKLDVPDNIKFCVMIPDFKLSTKQAREVLPKSLSMQDAVFNISRASMLTACMCQAKFDMLKHCIQDRVHQPYRKRLIPGIDRIFDCAKKAGACGTFISGAGPTLIAVVSHDYQLFKQKMVHAVSSLKQKWSVQIVDVCHKGAEIERI